MRRLAAGRILVAIAAALVLPSCIDVWVTPPTYAFRAVKLVDGDDAKVATLGAPDLTSGHCAMLGDASYVLRPDGAGTFQASTTTTRPGETWHQTASVFTEAGTTILDLPGWGESMQSANASHRWASRHFHFNPALYRGMDALEFQGECY